MSMRENGKSLFRIELPKLSPKSERRPTVPFRNQLLDVLAAFALVCITLAVPARAQFTQQGPKLVGTGAIGSFVEQGLSVSLSADGNTAIVGGPCDDSCT